jgi:cytochrome P450
MRFGQLEIKVIAAQILRRFRLELRPGYRLEIRQTPTLGPRRGMPVTIRGLDELSLPGAYTRTTEA